jgi:carbonic anhydrase
MRHLLIATILTFSSGTLYSYASKKAKQESDSIENRDRSVQVLTKDMQSKLTPDKILALLKKGNERFTKNQKIDRSYTSQVKQASNGQYPKAIVLSCVDSRVPVEDVFDQGIGDLFVARVAGNSVNADILGSIEFATKVAGSKLIVVMGHEHCGAVKSAIDDVKLGNITTLLEKIKPAIAKTNKSYKGQKSSSNPDYVAQVCHNHVQETIDQIRKQSSVVKQLEASGKVKIVGAKYDLDTGVVEFMEDSPLLAH